MSRRAQPTPGRAAVKLTGAVAAELIARAQAERRPIAWVAERLIRRGLEAEGEAPLDPPPGREG